MQTEEGDQCELLKDALHFVYSHYNLYFKNYESARKFDIFSDVHIIYPL